MTVISVPPYDEAAIWPTLGPQVCDWIEAYLTFGPGDLYGQRAVIDEEKRGLIYSFYEVHPIGAVDSNRKSIAGRRRFRHCAVSLQKGSAKTELAAWIAAAELHHASPVRCDGFRDGAPIGRPVDSPYIPMVAYTEEQAEDLAYGVLKAILEKSPIANDFDIGLMRITRAYEPHARALALAGAPDSRDGALTTFSHFDETHRWTLSRLKRAYGTMIANLTKRLIAEPWGLETTTAYSPGEGSIAEETHAYARDVESGVIPWEESKLFYFHRQASDGYDWQDPEQRRAALVEAAGASAAWKDIDGISALWQAPKADTPYLERVYGNRPIATAAQAFNATAWAANTRPGFACPRGSQVALGFDGSRNQDSTLLVATDLATATQWPLGIWQRPDTAADGWEIAEVEVDAVVEETFRAYDVVLLYADPSKWEQAIARWANKYGPNKLGRRRVLAWSTILYRKMATALKEYALDIEGGRVGNDGNRILAQHIGNAQRHPQNFRDDDGSPLWLIRKDRPFSPNKIDGAMAGCLSWQAYKDALAAGARPRGPVVLPGYGGDDRPSPGGLRDRTF